MGIDKLRKWITAPFLREAIQEDVARQCIRAQAAYCDANELPQFAPYDGICWHCGRSIYDGGISIDEASKQLITGCPFCHRSFAE